MTPDDFFTINAFAATDAPASGIKRVDPLSPFYDRHVVEVFAHYFLRESHHGSVQFEATEGGPESCDIPYTAYLFKHETMYVGACCFRWREWLDMPPIWSLDWVWIHPFQRRQKLLTKAWPRLKAEHGEFHIALPTSAAMDAFLHKIGHTEAEALKGK